jgi:hypothetical protein
MKGTGTVAALALVLAAGCGGEGAAVPSASSVPPNDMPACEDIYKQGAVVDRASFGLACVKDEVLISPSPVELECTDGTQLLFNDLAWGYLAEPMTITPDDDPSKMPEAAVDECLDPGAAGATTTTAG